MGKVIVDALITEVNDKKLEAKSKTSLTVGDLKTPEKKAIETKEEETIKKVLVNQNDVEKIVADDNGNVSIEYKDEKNDKEDNEKEEKSPVLDDGDDMIV